MKLRVYQTITNDVYVLTFVNDPSAISKQDQELMQKFGEPEINAGGDFGTSPDTFTLPEEYVKIKDGFPLRKEFDSRQTPFSTNTVTKVNSYRDAIVTRVTAAVTTLREEADTFTSEKIYNI